MKRALTAPGFNRCGRLVGVKTESACGPRFEAAASKPAQEVKTAGHFATALVVAARRVDRVAVREPTPAPVPLAQRAHQCQSQGAYGQHGTHADEHLDPQRHLIGAACVAVAFVVAGY